MAKINPNDNNNVIPFQSAGDDAEMEMLVMWLELLADVEAGEIPAPSTVPGALVRPMWW